ncbi:formyltransferase family protein [Yersinia kristensenii]|uniref:formyltransferase family protein n=2 Tax=Yersinia kristensenii TaxID=28152 RepID=UPI0005E87EC7|nr:formyltransferase family protein [Yersinia kristensenii]CNH18866.1 bifunctional UDP-glucuronic acid decarboxylase/UDP-4-amino-4-deoxy-L-arabinose formyltransferase [Yersinia kristensenii]CNK87460.1 bifunctional UDP-glucuronic acid decarboxylase/UDP-4-amino-4-deoxy-L-arabinose formyltransferase [Yersinia kristensenii]
MKIIIAGKNNIAVNVTEWILNNIRDICVYAVFNKNESGIDLGQRSFKKFCNEKNIKEISLDESYEINNAIFLSLEFDRIIKPERFSHSNIFNIHFSSLPKYKGMYTSAWPILNNEKTSGVTLHKIDSGIDTGPIIAKKDFELDDDETAKTLYSKYINVGTELVIRNIRELLDGDFFLTPQSCIDSSYYSRSSIDYRNININLNKTAFEILKQINAYTFRDFQLASVHGFNIFGGRILQDKSSQKPGCLVSNTESKIVISTVDFDIELYKDNFEEVLDLCKFGTPDEVKKIISTNRILFEKNTKGWSPIIVAAYHGNITLMRWLTEMGCDINDCNNNGTTVAMYYKEFISQSRDFATLNELINMGANLSLKDYSGKSIFDYTIESSDIELMNYFEGFRK